MEKISLLGKTVYPEKSKLLLSYSPADDWQAYNWAAAGICGRSWEGWRQQHSYHQRR